MMGLINGDAIQIPLADQSVHMVCCSPPYWGLRDYGLSTWIGGDPGCDHLPEEKKARKFTNGRDEGVDDNYAGSNLTSWTYRDGTMTDNCMQCGAMRHDTGIGLEPTLEEYLAKMVAVGREVWRVLRDDGTWWVNLGDSYDSKNLIGTPWRVAFALQDDGWFLRSDIIWDKRNPMPESATDRPTKAHEYIFLLTKRPKYFYDHVAVKEPTQSSSPSGNGYNRPESLSYRDKNGPKGSEQPWQLLATTRNRRTVWTIPTQPYSGAHFATWPEKLVEPMIRAGTSERGCCPECGAPWERVVEKEFIPQEDIKDPEKLVRSAEALDESSSWGGSRRGRNVEKTMGWKPTCRHDAKWVVDNLKAPVPCTVLDIFCGSGTTGIVARKLGQHFIGLDLSHEYLRDHARRRLELDRLAAFWGGTAVEAEEDQYSDLPLFGDLP